MPDFDIDFCQDGRDRVIDYVKKKYGAESVSQIATFGTMAAKAAVRDVGRVLDLPYLFCDGIAKLIPFQPGKQITLRQAREIEPLLAEREQKEEEVRELLALAEALEGLTRNVGMHAGGVLIAPGKLTDFCPLYTQAGSDAIVSQFDKDDVEAVGLVKFDFLGLTTLTILDWTLRYVKRLDPASELDARDAAARRQGRLRHLPDGQHRGGVPVRIARHARPHHAGAADALRGHHRARRAVPARADGAHPDVHGAQDRPRARRLSGSAARAHPRPDVRHHGVPGTGDADRAGDRRLHAGRRRPAAPRDGQEEQGGDGEAPRHLHRGRGEERRSARRRRRALRPDGEVRRLRLQQVARRRLRADRLPDRLHQGAPSGGVHGSQPVARDGRHRQGARALRRRASRNGLAILPPDVNSSNYRFEPVDREQHPLRARRHQGHGRAGHRGDRRGARRGRPVPRPVRFLPAHRQAARQSPRGRGARQRGAFDAIEPHRAMLFASVGVALERSGKGRAFRGAGVAVRRFARGSGTDARRRARMDGGRAARARERRRSASTCRGIRTRRSRRSSRRSSGCHSPSCSQGRSRR